MKVVGVLSVIASFVAALVGWGVAFGGDAWTWINRGVWLTMSVVLFIGGFVLIALVELKEEVRELSREIGREVGRMRKGDDA